jgi:hypothetical protein
MSSEGAEDPTEYWQAPRERAEIAAEAAPILLTVLSTEEEFDWSKPFDRAATSVLAAAHIERAQSVFDEYGVRPVYVVDYPIASQPHSVAPLKAIADSGRCEIGAHLHPWVSPPLDEPMSVRNSFPGNLPDDLEARKLRQLTETIEANFGRRPKTYQAGRYGFGPRTAQLLEREGYDADLSASPGFDYSTEGGPDYTDFDPQPFWFGARRRMLEIPVTGAFVGFARHGARGLLSAGQRAGLRWARVPAVLSRLGAIERSRLSPEGFDHAAQRRLTKTLFDRGVRVFVFSFHSPSLMPGCTPYVRDERELARFLDNCRRYYQYFLGELGGTSMTAQQLVQHLRAHAPQGSR